MKVLFFMLKYDLPISQSIMTDSGSVWETMFERLFLTLLDDADRTKITRFTFKFMKQKLINNW